MNNREDSQAFYFKQIRERLSNKCQRVLTNIPFQTNDREALQGFISTQILDRVSSILFPTNTRGVLSAILSN